MHDLHAPAAGGATFQNSLPNLPKFDAYGRLSGHLFVCPALPFGRPLSRTRTSCLASARTAAVTPSVAKVSARRSLRSSNSGAVLHASAPSRRARLLFETRRIRSASCCRRLHSTIWVTHSTRLPGASSRNVAAPSPLLQSRRGLV